MKTADQSAASVSAALLTISWQKTREARQVTLYKVSTFRQRRVTVDNERGVTRSLFF